MASMNFLNSKNPKVHLNPLVFYGLDFLSAFSDEEQEQEED